MSARHFYNEIDPFMAEGLREMIDRGMLCSGDVEERSIEDIEPAELLGYDQCHFFCGVGGWPLAMRAAGWPDERPAWTGSCPCQPFSEAGKGLGFADERHLFPAFFHLIRFCRPPAILGEQVASAVEWIDLVRLDLEAEGYAFGPVDLGAPLVGAPHIRQRFYWLAYDHRDGCEARSFLRLYDGQREPQPCGGSGGLADSPRRGRKKPEIERSRVGELDPRRNRAPERLADAVRPGRPKRRAGPGIGPTAGRGSAGRVGDAGGEQRFEGREPRPGDGQGGQRTPTLGSPVPARAGSRGDAAIGMVDPEGVGREAGGDRALGDASRLTRSEVPSDACGLEHGGRPGPLYGFWRAADWLFCRDGKWRPVEPGSFPLAHGLPKGSRRRADLCDLPREEQAKHARKEALSGYGNAIVLPLAVEFVGASMEAIEAMG